MYRHGVRQLRTGWADGPEFVTQCPIRPGGSYTYKFTIQGQEGTLWWHAHSSWLRATVYGALIIRPKEGESYPFPKPMRETPLLLGNELSFLCGDSNYENDDCYDYSWIFILFFLEIFEKLIYVGGDQVNGGMQIPLMLWDKPWEQELPLMFQMLTQLTVNLVIFTIAQAKVGFLTFSSL